jgi:hypothetical protein
MFWRFLFTLFVADIICTLAFAVLITALLAPLLLVARKESMALVAAVGILVAVVAGASQIYFWGLWAAFCSATAAKYSAMPEISQHWVYYLVAFMACTAPLSYLASQEVAAAQNSAEANNTRRGTAMYGVIAIVAFIAFSVWPNLYSWPYSWALAHIV